MVFDAAVVGNQNPERVNAESGSYRRMEERENTQHDGDSARPGLAVAQTNSHENSAHREDQKRSSDKGHHGGTECVGKDIVVDDEVRCTAHKKECESRNEENDAHYDPQNTQNGEMIL